LCYARKLQCGVPIPGIFACGTTQLNRNKEGYPFVPALRCGDAVDVVTHVVGKGIASMMFFSLRAWVGRIRRHRHKSYQRSYLKPRLEVLEGRVLPAPLVNGGFNQGA